MTIIISPNYSTVYAMELQTVRKHLKCYHPSLLFFPFILILHKFLKNSTILKHSLYVLELVCGYLLRLKLFFGLIT